MTEDVRTRLRWVIGACTVLVVLVSVVVWSLAPPPLRGDVAWQVSAEELGFAPNAPVQVSKVAGDMFALETKRVSAVVDGAGRPVHTDLPVAAWQLREDGSGWGSRFVSASADGRTEIVAWDEDGAVTDIYRSDDDVARVLQEAGIEVDGRVPQPAILAHVSDAVVLGGCHEEGPDVSYSYLVGLDTRTGDVVWSEQRPGDCVLVGYPRRRDAGAFTAPEVTDEPIRVLDVATGRELWRLPTDAQSAAVVPDREVLWWTGGTLHRLDPGSGEAAWSRDLCNEGDATKLLPPTSATVDVVQVRCDGARWAVDVGTGETAELPEGTEIQGYRTPSRQTPSVALPELGSVVAELRGSGVVATDPVTGQELWTHDVESTPDALRLRSHAGPRATVVLSDVEGDDGGTAGIDQRTLTSVLVLDARTGETLARSDETRGTWQVSSVEDGSTLAGLSKNGSRTLFLVRGLE